MNQPYATLTLASALRMVFGVQLYKNNARVLLLRILSILNSDWLQHARSVCKAYECVIKVQINFTHKTCSHKKRDKSPEKELKGKRANWMWTLFSASWGAHLLFSSDWTSLLSIHCCSERVTSPLHTEPVTVTVWAGTHFYTWVERNKLK